MRIQVNNFEVIGEYYAKQDYVHTYRNGDPGHEEFPAQFEIYEVLSNDINIIDQLTDNDLSNLEKQAINEVEAN